MKKLYSLLFSTLFITALVQGQTDIIIGAGSVTGTTTNSAANDAGPMYCTGPSSSFVYSKHHFVYTATELASAGIVSGDFITKLSWYKANTAAYSATTAVIFDIYMKNSTATGVPNPVPQSFATIITGATQVYASTSQSFPATIGWVEFILSTPFLYTGGAIEITTNWDVSAGGSAASGATANFAWAKDPGVNVLSHAAASQSPNFTFLRTSRAQIRFTIGQSAGGCNINTQPTANDTTFCLGEGAVLQATPGSMQNSVIWTNSSGQFLYNGNTYLTQPLYANTFFVAHDANTDTIGAHVGPLTSISAQGYQNSNNGLYATVHGYMFFDSVTVRSDGVSTYKVKVWDHAQTNLIAESQPRLSTGTIDTQQDVGILLGPGNYFFTIEQVSGNAQYFRATSGASYPYEIQGLVSIDSSSGGNLAAYYYLFDWVVRGICIDSTGTTVNVTEIPAGASATGNQQSLSSTECLWQFNGSQSVGATNYNWDFGNGSSASGVNVFHAFVANGSYQVILTVDTDCGPKSDTLDIVVAGIGLEESAVDLVNVFPNPTRDQMVISFESGQAQTIRMELVNSLGQQIWAETVQNHSGAYRKELSLGTYAKGIYHLRIHTATGTHTERISLQ